MPGYWVTFRLSGDATPHGGAASTRREAFMAVFSELTNKVWAEPADFVVFDAPASIEIVADMLQAAIDPAHDMFLLHEINGEDAILCGSYADADILLFMPHLRTLV